MAQPREQVANSSSRMIDIYRWAFGGRHFYRLNRALYFLSLRGLGICNWETTELSGERYFINWFATNIERPLVIDIGANIGSYSNLLKEVSRDARIFAFEPHPLTFKKLQASAAQNDYIAVNAACGAETSTAKLYDHFGGGDEIGTEHASLFQNVIEAVHSKTSEAWEIEVMTLDDFVRENGIERIDLLKIDVEGGELNVLLGANETLASQMIDIIHFEFTEANTVSRVFMKDFYDLLPDFEFYRMLPDGLAPLGTYYSPIAEIFAYQNIVAMRKGVRSWM